MNFLRLAMMALVLAMAGGLLAQEATEKARIDRIREEVARRRKLLETAHGERGIVFAPYRYEADGTKPLTRSLWGDAVVLAALLIGAGSAFCYRGSE